MKLGHTPSQPKPVRQGVLQGSILCPFLFLLFVHDMPLHLNKSTMIYMLTIPPCPCVQTGTIITSFTKALSNDLENIEKWSTGNKMYINTEKTKALFVTGKRLQYKLRMETNYTLTPQISTKYCITSYWV